MSQIDVPGYTYGTDAVPRSPVSLQELELLQATLLLGEDDLAALRRSSDILAPQVEEILDVWYGFVGANPHLLAAFSNAQGEPDQAPCTRRGSRPSCSR
jgi:Protoglobin